MVVFLPVFKLSVSVPQKGRMDDSVPKSSKRERVKDSSESEGEAGKSQKKAKMEVRDSSYYKMYMYGCVLHTNLSKISC